MFYVEHGNNRAVWRPSPDAGGLGRHRHTNVHRLGESVSPCHSDPFSGDHANGIEICDDPATARRTDAGAYRFSAQVAVTTVRARRRNGRALSASLLGMMSITGLLIEGGCSNAIRHKLVRVAGIAAQTAQVDRWDLPRSAARRRIRRDSGNQPVGLAVAAVGA